MWGQAGAHRRSLSPPRISGTYAARHGNRREPCHVDDSALIMAVVEQRAKHFSHLLQHVYYGHTCS